MRLSMLMPARMPGNKWHRRRRRYAVERDSSSCDRVVGSAPGEHAGAIRGMEWRQPHSGAAHRVDHVLEFLKLRGRERLVWFVRGGEMGEDAGKAKIWVACDPGCEGNRL